MLALLLLTLLIFTGLLALIYLLSLSPRNTVCPRCKKKKDLEEIERMSKLGATYLKAYLLTKQAFYANYQSEHLEQADFSLETYLARIASELDRESSHVQAYLSKEKVNQSLANLANNSIQITSQALNEKDQIIKYLEQKLANCSCPKEAPHA